MRRPEMLRFLDLRGCQLADDNTVGGAEFGGGDAHSQCVPDLEVREVGAPGEIAGGNEGLGGDGRQGRGGVEGCYFGIEGGILVVSWVVRGEEGVTYLGGQRTDQRLGRLWGYIGHVRARCGWTNS
jgi:hypothetical protein